MADLKKTVAIEFETNAAKAAKDTKKLADAQEGVAKATKKSWTALDTHNARMRNASDAAKSMAAKQREANRALREKRELLESNVQQIGVYAAGMAAAAVVVDKLSQRAMALDDVQRNLPFSIEKARKASRGLVDTFTLQQQAMAANTLGAAQTSEEFEKLVKVATTLARAQGKDATKGVEDFTTALARGSPQILDNLGLTLKMSEAQRIYADHLGISVSELSEAKKAEAFRFAALKKGEDVIENITLAEDTLAIKIQKSKVEIIETGDALVQLANKLGTAADAYGAFDGKLGQLTGLSNLTINALDAADAIRRLNNLLSPDVVHGELIYDDRDRLRKENAAQKAIEDAQAVGAAWQEAIDQQQEYERLQEIDQRNFNAQNKGKKGRGKGRTIKDILGEKISSQGEFSSDFLNDSAEQDNSDRISRMRDAQKDFAEDQEEAARKRDEAEAALQENIKKRHEERLRLIEEEKEAEQKKLRSISRGVAEWSSLAGETASIGAALADAQGMSAERAARLQNRFLGMQSFGRAAFEIVEAAAAVARYDYAGAALHSAAAALGIVKGGLLVSGALDPSGGGDTSGASMPTASSSGPVTTASELPDGPISRPNTDAPPQNGGQNTSPQTAQQTNVVVIENFNTLGTTPDEQANAIQQMLDDRQRKVGNA